jgi:hypothetical protein
MIDDEKSLIQKYNVPLDTLVIQQFLTGMKLIYI